MTDKPLISFVVPTYDRVQWVGECISGLLGQTVPEIEVVVVDDGSKDGTWEFLTRWLGDNPKVKLHRNETNMGAGQSRNKGIELASADIIAVCDSDDIYPVTRAERILKFFKDVPEGAMINAGYVRIGYCNDIIEKFDGGHFDHEEFKKTGSINYFCHPSAAYTKKDILEIGGYKSETKDKTDDRQLVEDWVAAGKRIAFDNEDYQCFHRVLPNSIMVRMRGWSPEWTKKKGLVSLV